MNELKRQCRLLISMINSPSTGIRLTSILALHSMLLSHPRTYHKLFNADNRSSMLTILLTAINSAGMSNEEFSTATDSFTALIGNQNAYQTLWLESLAALQWSDWKCYLDLSSERIPIHLKLFLSLPPSKQWEITEQHPNFPQVLISYLRATADQSSNRLVDLIALFDALAVCLEGDSAKSLQKKLFNFMDRLIHSKSTECVEFMGLFVDKILPILSMVDIQSFSDQCSLPQLAETAIDTAETSDQGTIELGLFAIVILNAVDRHPNSHPNSHAPYSAPDKMQRYGPLIAHTIAFSTNEIALDYALRVSNQLPRQAVSYQIARERREQERYRSSNSFLSPESSIWMAQKSSIVSCESDDNKENQSRPCPQVDSLATQLQAVKLKETAQQPAELEECLKMEIKKQCLEHEAAMAENQASMDRAKYEITERLQAELNIERDRLLKTHETALEELKSKFSALENDLENLDSVKQSLEKQIAQTETQLILAQAAEEEQRNRFESEKSRINGVIEHLERIAEERNVRIQSLERELVAVRESAGDWQRRFESETAQCDNLACQVAEKDMIILELQSELDKVKHKLSESTAIWDGEMESLRNNLRTFENEVSAERQHRIEMIKQMEDQIQKQQAKISQSDEYIYQLEDDLDKHVRAISILQSLSADTKSRQRKRDDQ